MAVIAVSFLAAVILTAWPRVAASLTLTPTVKPITATQISIAPASSCQTHKSNTAAFKGEASLVYFYMGDDELTTLAQETTDLSLAFKNAQYKLLLLDQKGSAGTRYLKSKAISQADKIYEPTSENFLAAIHDAVDEGYVVNVWIFSHGNSYVNGKGETVAYFVTQDGILSNRDLEDEFGGGCELPIRMVYSIACYHADMNATWTALGAKSVAGARFINFYPTQYAKFANEWAAGKSFKTALSNSNTEASRTIVQSYIAFLSLEVSDEGECGWIPNVLGKTDCAEWYFTDGGPYGLGSDYDPAKSGKGNMNSSSTKIVGGSGSYTRKSTLSWKL